MSRRALRLEAGELCAAAYSRRSAQRGSFLASQTIRRFLAHRAALLHGLGVLTAVSLIAVSPANADTVVPVTSASAQNANDWVTWSQLGPDATTLGASFAAASAGSISVAGALGGSGSLVSVVCPASPCSWGNSTGFTAGDSLIWVITYLTHRNTCAMFEA